MRDGRAEPLLQLRTQLNATRELDRLTHLAGHIMQDEPAVPGAEFGLDDEIPMAAARSRVQMETGRGRPGGVAAAGHRPVHPSGQGAPVLLRLRLSASWRTCSSGTRPRCLRSRSANCSPSGRTRCWARRCRCAGPPRCAARSARPPLRSSALNLILHDYGDLAQKLTDAAAARTADFGAIAAELGRAGSSAPGKPGRGSSKRQKSRVCRVFSSGSSSRYCCPFMSVSACRARPSTLC